MQRMFLPRPLENNSAHVRVLAEYLPAFAVGGDFYDFVDLGGGRLLATIGDVSGKGVTAALMMSRVTSELRRLAHECSGPAEILTRLNRSLRGMQDDRFVTVVCVLLDVPNRRWIVANGGHVVPLLRRRSGVISGLAYSLNPPIGMIPMPSTATRSSHSSRTTSCCWRPTACSRCCRAGRATCARRWVSASWSTSSARRRTTWPRSTAAS